MLKAFGALAYELAPSSNQDIQRIDAQFRDIL